MQLLLLATAAALRLRAAAAPESESCTGACAAGREEVASARWTQCWHDCALPHGDAARSGDAPACLADCVEAGQADLGAGAWKEAHEAEQERADDQAVQDRFAGFWDTACEAGLGMGCRTVPERVAQDWLRLEVHINRTREQGRQWLLREQDQDFDAHFAAFNLRLVNVTATKEDFIAGQFLNAYLNETGQASDQAALEAAKPELASAARTAFRRSRALLLKEKAERDSEKELTAARAKADSAKAAGDLAGSALSGEEAAAHAASVTAAWRGAHAAADSAHRARVKEAWGTLDA